MFGDFRHRTSDPARILKCPLLGESPAMDFRKLSARGFELAWSAASRSWELKLWVRRRRSLRERGNHKATLNNGQAQHE